MRVSSGFSSWALHREPTSWLLPWYRLIFKVSAIFNAVIFGSSQSTQPILGYHYGAGKYGRVKETFKKAVTIVTCISCAAFLCFHIFLFCTFIVGAQILCAQFFPAIGEGGIGTIVSLSRQVFFLLPLVILFSLIWGINGVLWASPISDGLSGVMALLLVHRKMQDW